MDWDTVHLREVEAIAWQTRLKSGRGRFSREGPLHVCDEAVRPCPTPQCLPAAQAKGRERYEGFVEALGRRLARGRTLAS
jgi:hypothetical protein